MTSLTKRYLLRALHQLPSESGHPGEQYLHGHTYGLEVEISGVTDPQSGLLFSRHRLDQIVEDKILKPYGNKNLNRLLEWTSGEALSVKFYDELSKTDLKPFLKSVALKETAKNWFRAAD